jgi:hypothetical protein
MPATVNNTGQLNLLLFEVVRVRRTFTPQGAATALVNTIALHPLVISPNNWRWTDTSRSTVMETGGDRTVHTKAGRALRMGRFAGSFGVASAGLGPYIGTGEIRRQRFYNEVVRLSDALTKHAVEEAINLLSGSPQISFLLADYNEDTDLFAINLYDLWHQLAFEVQIQSFEFIRTAKSADGRSDYNLLVKEAGPLVQAGGFQAVLSKLMSGLVAWDTANELVKGTTLEDTLNAHANALGVGIGELADTSQAVAGQVDAATRLFSGDTRGSFASVAANEGISNLLGNAKRAVQGMEDVAGVLRRQGVSAADFTGTPPDPTPRVRSDGAIVVPDGTDDIAELRAFDELSAFLDVRDAMAQQDSMGRLFGMSDAEFSEYLSGGSTKGHRRPEIAGSSEYVVLLSDTPAGLQRAFGVPFERIVEANQKTPDELLRPGTTIDIPVRRSSGPQSIDGLPTFDSHIGKTAWGRDLSTDFDVDEQGDLAVVSEDDVLTQGAALLIADIEAELLRTTQGYGDLIRTRFLSARVSTELTTDPRIQAVTQIDLLEDGGGGVGLSVTLRAINGVTLRTGGP